MSKSRKKLPDRPAAVPTVPCPDRIVIQSHGMGVESQAILERWMAEPASRPFVRWDQLIVVTAQVGEEHKNDTIRDMEFRTLPLLRRFGVRFVELARKGHLEEDGIVVLQDTREPYELHPDGVYKLSDELLMSGTVPQFGGEHRCAMKFKAFVIEAWLAFEFQHLEQKVPVHHVFGYNADEISRVQKSDMHIDRHNDEKAMPRDRTPLMVFGFNSEELGRIDRSAVYDGPSRIGNYPLEEWGWDRQKCLDYIHQRSNIWWRKSHCSFCPFCKEAEKGEAGAVARWEESPEATAHGMLVEYNSLCFNPRGHLYKSEALGDVVRMRQVGQALVEFAKKLDSIQWGYYRVRRIYTAKGKAVRCVEPLMKGTREEATLAYERGRTTTLPDEKHGRGITYRYVHEREEGKYPSREEFYVVAPGFMDLKVRGALEKFEARWSRVGRGLPMNIPANDEVPEGCDIVRRDTGCWHVHMVDPRNPESTAFQLAMHTDKGTAIRKAWKAILNLEKPWPQLEKLREEILNFKGKTK